MKCFTARHSKFIYSEKSTKFCKISTLFLSYTVPVSWRFAKFCGLLRIYKLCRTRSQYINATFLHYILPAKAQPVRTIKYSCKLRGRYIDTFPTLDELAQLLVVGDRGGFLRLLFQRQPSVEASILQQSQYTSLPQDLLFFSDRAHSEYKSLFFKRLF